MQRITYLGPTKAEFDNSGIYSLNSHYQKAQSATLADIEVTLPPITPYVRPADWLAIPDVNSGDEVFYGLFAVFDHDSNVASLYTNTDINIDWGMGAGPQFYAAGSSPVYVYDFAAMDNSTLTSKGYKQVIITITPDTGSSLRTLVIGNTAAPYNRTVSHWLDIAVAGPLMDGLQISGNFAKKPVYLEQVKIEQNNQSNWSYMFRQCKSLQNIRYIDMSNTSGNGAIDHMFSSCYSLQTPPAMTTNALTGYIGDVFTECFKLQSLPWLNTSLASGISRIATGSTITELPAYDTSNFDVLAQSFWALRFLQKIPKYNTKNVTNWSYAFESCYSIREIDLDMSASTSALDGTFRNCYSVEQWQYTITGSGFYPLGLNFMSNNSLRRMPNWSIIRGSLLASMLGSTAIEQVPPLTLPEATTIEGMFSSTYSLDSADISAPLATNAQSVFSGSLGQELTLNIPSATNISYAFSFTYWLNTVDIITTSALTTANNAFWYTKCRYPCAVDLTNVTDCSNMYSYSYVAMLPDQNMSGVTNLTDFLNNSRIYSIPDYDWSNVTTFTTAFEQNSSLTDIRAYGMKYTMNLAATSLSKSAMEYVFNNLGSSHLASQTITVNNLSHYNTAPVSKSVTTTAGSTTVTAADTSNLYAGQFVTGTNISTPVAVTFTDSGDTVDLAGHGLTDGTVIGFTSITSTTGISTYTVYYVINAALNNFQISTSVGGSPVSLTNDGSGNMYYANYIASIVPNTSVTLTAPASASGSTTLTATYLDCSKAIAKGWTVIF